MTSEKLWRAPRRPWEPIALVSALVLASLVLPGWIHQHAPRDLQVTLMDRAKVSQDVWSFYLNRAEAPWILVTLALYFVYLFAPNTLLSRVTLSLQDMVAPLFFGLLAYIRILRAATQARLTAPGLEVSAGWILTWVLALLAANLLVVTLIALRHRIRWRKSRWDLRSPPTRDGSFRRLLVNLYPLFYLPREYRFCAEGLQIVGPHFLLSIPISEIDSVRLERKADTSNLIAGAAYLATSTKSILRLVVKGFRRPIYISPKKHSAALMYIRIARSQKKARSGAVTTVAPH